MILAYRIISVIPRKGLIQRSVLHSQTANDLLSKSYQPTPDFPQMVRVDARGSVVLGAPWDGLRQLKGLRDYYCQTLIHLRVH